MQTPQTYRQGDVLLVKVDALPKGAKPADRDEADRVVLALGEEHGHAHAFREKTVCGFKMETAEGDVANRALVDYIQIGGGGAALKHELIDGAKADHDQIDLPEGTYKVVQQRQYVAPPLEAPQSQRNLAAWD